MFSLFPAVSPPPHNDLFDAFCSFGNCNKELEERCLFPNFVAVVAVVVFAVVFAVVVAVVVTVVVAVVVTFVVVTVVVAVVVTFVVVSVAVTVFVAVVVAPAVFLSLHLSLFFDFRPEMRENRSIIIIRTLATTQQHSAGWCQ